MCRMGKMGPPSRVPGPFRSHPGAGHSFFDSDDGGVPLRQSRTCGPKIEQLGYAARPEARSCGSRARRPRNASFHKDGSDSMPSPGGIDHHPDFGKSSSDFYSDEPRQLPLLLNEQGCQVLCTHIPLKPDLCVSRSSGPSLPIHFCSPATVSNSANQASKSSMMASRTLRFRGLHGHSLVHSSVPSPRRVLGGDMGDLVRQPERHDPEGRSRPRPSPQLCNLSSTSSVMVYRKGTGGPDGDTVTTASPRVGPSPATSTTSVRHAHAFPLPHEPAVVR